MLRAALHSLFDRGVQPLVDLLLSLSATTDIKDIEQCMRHNLGVSQHAVRTLLAV
jgi:hypothetical protein